MILCKDCTYYRPVRGVYAQKPCRRPTDNFSHISGKEYCRSTTLANADFDCPDYTERAKRWWQIWK